MLGLDAGGYRAEPARCAGRWHAALAELAIGFADIRQIVLTHTHPDHFGMAGWFQVQSGAGLDVAARWNGPIRFGSTMPSAPNWSWIGGMRAACRAI
ncbi:MAG: MBL fold metallo-hydrolase [Caldilineaceae bacterium]